MLTLKESINTSIKLQKLLNKSARRKRQKSYKNYKYCQKSKKIRKREIEEKYPLERLKKGRKMFPVMCFFIRLRLILNGVRIKKLNKFKRLNNKYPVIFVPTHIGKYDIEVVYSCIHEHALLLSGTEERMHGTIDGFLLEKNGVNYVDRSDKEDRTIAVKKMQKDLYNGFHLLWFVEGTWNLSANQLVYDISYSVIKLALECKVAIIPIGLNQMGKKIYIKFGDPFFPDPQKNLAESILVLRDQLATLKWQIYEYVAEKTGEGYINRESLDKNYWTDYLTERIKEWPLTDLMEELNYVYHPKDEAHVFFEEFCAKFR